MPAKLVVTIALTRDCSHKVKAELIFAGCWLVSVGADSFNY